MNTNVRNIMVLLLGVFLLAGCNEVGPPAKRSPTWTPTVPVDGTVCSLPVEFWTSYLGDVELGEYISDPYGRQPDPDDPTSWYGCTLHFGKTGGKFTYANDIVARFTVSTWPPGDSLIDEANSVIQAAGPEQSFEARGHKGWLYPGHGPLPVGGGENTQYALITWACGNTVFDISVELKNANGKGPELAKAAFDKMVDGVTCDA